MAKMLASDEPGPTTSPLRRHSSQIEDMNEEEDGNPKVFNPNKGQGQLENGDRSSFAYPHDELPSSSHSPLSMSTSSDESDSPGGERSRRANMISVRFENQKSKIGPAVRETHIDSSQPEPRVSKTGQGVKKETTPSRKRTLDGLARESNGISLTLVRSDQVSASKAASKRAITQNMATKNTRGNIMTYCRSSDSSRNCMLKRSFDYLPAEIDSS